MKSLIIIAHPSYHGFARDIAQTYNDAIQEKGGESFILDLYAPEWKQDFLAFQHVREDFPITEITKRIQAHIAWADELIITAPMWNFGHPAILKNFYDCNFTTGFAFQYQAGKSMPAKLLTGKKLKVFTTCDGPAWFYNFLAPIIRHTYKAQYGFCGIKLVKNTIFDHMRNRDEEGKNKLLERVKVLVS